MPEYKIAYGKKEVSFEIPAGCQVGWIEPAYVAPAPDPEKVIEEALANPVDGIRLSDFPQAKSAVIAVNDKTRPVPNQHMLPPLLRELERVGIGRGQIKFLIATGTHIPMPAEEFPRILPEEMIGQYEIISHNCDDDGNLEFCGTTSRKTPVWANRTFRAADLRIVVGNIEPHHFAGFSGGHKTAAIGLTGRQTINTNHVMLVDPGARIAEYAGNPLRQDIEEIGELVGANFAVNAILNGEKKIVSAVCGAPKAVMQAGIPISQQICQIQTQERYDIVVASVGGAPKDINFYQSQKALSHASLFTRDGGVIILAAACPEGTGSRAYEEYMQGLTTPGEVMDKFRATGFRVGPHKAFQVARDALRVRIILVSEIPAEKVQGLLMSPAGSVTEAIQKAFDMLSPTPSGDLRIAVLPRATNTVPV